MSEDLKERAQPHDQEAIQGMIDSAKAFFTGTMATCGRRTDLDRNVFYARHGQGAHRICAEMKEAEEGEASGGAGSFCSCACALCVCASDGWWPWG